MASLVRQTTLAQGLFGKAMEMERLGRAAEALTA